MNIVAIIQARMGATRLPGKVLFDLVGKSVLERVIDRVKAGRYINEVTVATTNNEEDLAIVMICNRIGIRVYCGKEEDVLDRYYQASQLFEADQIVRVTADCPLIDPGVIDQVISLHLESAAEYTSNVLKYTYPDGEDVEVFSSRTLEKIWKSARLKSEREHVTMYIRKNPALFKLESLEYKEDLSDKRWTLDEPSDYEFIKIIYSNLYSGNRIFSMNDVLKLLREFPGIEDTNRHIRRNEGYLKSLRND